jgi:predicted glycogen debranching enzyme
VTSPTVLSLGRHLASRWPVSSTREWLVTNGLGGYAAGTVAGANTRRYHGLLVASIKPPTERVLLLATIQLVCRYLGERYELGSNEFADGTISPTGHAYIELFELQDGIPTWHYALADGLLRKQIFMTPGANTTWIGLQLLRGSAPVDVELAPLCTYRDYHSHSRGAQPFQVESTPDTCTIRAFDGAVPLRLHLEQSRFVQVPEWYWSFLHRVEAERGLDSVEDLFTPGRFDVRLQPLDLAYFSATVEADLGEPAQKVVQARTLKTQAAVSGLPDSAPLWTQQLAVAADQFIVRRRTADSVGLSIIAGYPWFTDWGRDAMIALPGLTSSLGRHEVAAQVLRTFASFVDHGMLPNRFPDQGEHPEYNTADATLWLFHALQCHLDASADFSLGIELLPTLLAIIRAHVDGTRHGIGVDPRDGLLRAGEPGSQLTWMDAKVGDWVVTPRWGKAVEINALWLNALHVTVELARRAKDRSAADECQALLVHAATHFSRFWNSDKGCLYDVIDVAGGPQCDDSVRPNQIFAVSLPHCVLPPAEKRAVVDTCASTLLTSYGLRSLSPTDVAYVPQYEGSSWHRDGAYHQGTVWSWLLGPFALAHFRVYGDAAFAQSYLEPIAHHLLDACIGTVSEIFDGAPPHQARGGFAQAWSVGEVLRAWIELEHTKSAHQAAQ